jgi:hypothetical protein
MKIVVTLDLEQLAIALAILLSTPKPRSDARRTVPGGLGTRQPRELRSRPLPRVWRAIFSRPMWWVRVLRV